MNVLNFEFDTNTGFAWIIVDGKNDGDKFTVQCCLKQPEFNCEQEEFPDFLKEIDCVNCGHNDGLCGEGNEPAFKYWGENRCMTELFNAAKKAGIVCND